MMTTSFTKLKKNQTRVDIVISDLKDFLKCKRLFNCLYIHVPGNKKKTVSFELLTTAR